MTGFLAVLAVLAAHGSRQVVVQLLQASSGLVLGAIERRGLAGTQIPVRTDQGASAARAELLGRGEVVDRRVESVERARRLSVHAAVDHGVYEALQR